MSIYIIYFVLVIVVPVLFRRARISNADDKALRVLIFLLFLLFVLRAPTVGRDIPGYENVYNNMTDHALGDFSFIYFEPGYILLMKLFSLMGASFQTFICFVYAIVVIPIYLLLRRYSTNYSISLLIYLSLNSFCFAMSGIRQTIALSICILAYMVLKESRRRYSTLLFIILVLVASTFHKSAVLFFLVLFVVRFRLNIWTGILYVAAFFFCFTSKGFFLSIAEDNLLTNYSYDENLELGGLFVLYVLLFLATFYTFIIKKRAIKTQPEHIEWLSVFLFGLLTMAAFQGSMLMRASGYFTIYLTVIIPRAISQYSQSTRIIITAVLTCFLFFLFYTNVLLPSQLDIVPYKFFFE